MKASWVVLAGVLWAPAALAQDVGATLWLSANTESVRFVGERVAGPEFNAGAEAIVLAVEGGKVRIMVAERFGWVDPGVLTSTAPVEEAPQFELPPGFQLQMPGGTP
jgi:hypothetical protein